MRPVAEDTGAVVRADVLGCLAKSYLFEGLDVEQLAPLADQATTRRLLRGEVVIRVGDRADELFVVLEGEVKDSVVDANGEEVVHFLHGPGMTFGEPGFFAVEHRRIVEVVATAQSVLIRLDRRVLIPFMNRHPVTKDRALEKLASNERWRVRTFASARISRFGRSFASPIGSTCATTLSRSMRSCSRRA